MKRMTLNEMLRLVQWNATGWTWIDRENNIGRITTREGGWTWDDEEDCYVLMEQPEASDPVTANLESMQNTFDKRASEEV